MNKTDIDRILLKYFHEIIDQLKTNRLIDENIYMKHKKLFDSVKTFYYFYNKQSLRKKYASPKLTYSNLNEYLNDKKLELPYKSNYIIWDEELISQHKNKINWRNGEYCLSSANNIKWNKAIILNFIKIFDTEKLFKNKTIIWTKDLIDIFINNSNLKTFQ
jgi:hypothetical protein